MKKKKIISAIIIFLIGVILKESYSLIVEGCITEEVIKAGLLPMFVYFINVRINEKNGLSNNCLAILSVIGIILIAQNSPNWYNVWDGWKTVMSIYCIAIEFLCSYQSESGFK